MRPAASLTTSLALDAKPGKATGEEIAVPAPAWPSPARYTPVSGKQIMKVDVGSKLATPLMTANLAPHNVDAAGNIYVK